MDSPSKRSFKLWHVSEILKSFLKIPKIFWDLYFCQEKTCLSSYLGIFVMYISRFKSFDFVTWVWWNGSSINNVTIFKGGQILIKNLMTHCGKKKVTWGIRKVVIEGMACQLPSRWEPRKKLLELDSCALVCTMSSPFHVKKLHYTTFCLHRW